MARYSGGDGREEDRGASWGRGELLVFYEQGRRLKKVLVKGVGLLLGKGQWKGTLVKIKCILMTNDKSTHIKPRSAEYSLVVLALPVCICVYLCACVCGCVRVPAC